MRALLCHCRHHLEAADDEALFDVVRDHLILEHPAIVPTNEQVSEIVATRSYYLEHAPVHAGSNAFEEEEFGLSLTELLARERPTGGRAL